MIQGGDITAGNGTGGLSIYGDTFADENLNWRGTDSPYLVCMANRGPNTNSSQFFITLDSCDHLNGKHTVFGQIVGGKAIVDKLAKLAVDAEDKPNVPVIVSHCGELERKKKSSAPSTGVSRTTTANTARSSPSRGRRKRRPSHSPSPSHSSSASLPKEPESSKDTYRHRHRRQRSDLPPPLNAAEEESEERRRNADHTSAAVQGTRAAVRESESGVRVPVDRGVRVPTIDDREACRISMRGTMIVRAEMRTQRR
jgi:peptidyl-prolyl isomerase G (cyclophilin G)